MSIEQTTAERLPTSGTAREHGRVDSVRLWQWVVRYAPADRATQRALYQACANALAQVNVDQYDTSGRRLIPRIVERTIDRHLAQLLGVSEPRGRRARARLKVLAMTRRRAPVDQPAADAQVTPLTMASPTDPDGGTSARSPERQPTPANLLPPEAPLEMPEQDLS